MTLKQAHRLFNFTFLALLFILVVGTPLFFTPYTRSVFEVNKMLLLRIIILITYLLWFIKTALFQHLEITPSKNSITLLGYKWEKTGLELPMLLWLGVNIASTIFSQNLRVSLYGCYDRWEGLITLIGYMLLIFMFAKLITSRKQLFWIIGGIIGSTVISAWYGILQSHGHDFMHWSKDPTFRVFACINNPVHFCAYVAMVVPLGLGLLLYLSHKEEYKAPTKKPYILLALILVLGLILVYTFTFTGFSMTFVQMILLLLIGYLLSTQNITTLPTKETILYWSGYIGLILGLVFSDLITFNKDQWLGYVSIMLLFFIVSPIPNTRAVLKRLIFVSTGIIFYTQILSFSRATWVGFLLMMPILFMYLSNQLSVKTEKKFFKDIIFTLIGIAVLVLVSLFKLHEINTLSLVSIVKYGCFILIPIYFLISPIMEKEVNNLEKNKTSLYALIGIFLAYWAFFILNIPALHNFEFIIKLTGMILLFKLSTLSSTTLSLHISRLSIIFTFLFVQYSGQSILNFITYSGLCFLFYYNTAQSKDLKKEQRFWLLLQLISFGLIMCIPTLFLIKESTLSLIKETPVLFLIINSLLLIIFTLYALTLIINIPLKKQKLLLLGLVIFSILSVSLIIIKQDYKNKEIENEKGLVAAENIQDRTQLYSHQTDKSARISMWKSAIPWVKDFPLLGTGPDTIKYMYPVYRRPEYGKLEGGHNFTPDRLHNEYINTLATRGILGFIIYYGFLILTWFYLSLKGVYKYRHSPLSYISLSFFIGANIYLGQVLFNFGVVATLVLFYVCLGLSLAMANHPLLYEKSSTKDIDND